jgi:hypothetical protein
MGRLTHRTGPGWTYFATTKAWQNVMFYPGANFSLGGRGFSPRRRIPEQNRL